MAALPTDTVYGLIALAKDNSAVYKIFKLKNRDFNKPLPLFVDSLKMAKELAFIDDEQKAFIKNKWPGAFTFILKSKVDYPLIVKDGKIGLRMPRENFVLKIISKLFNPLAQTSVNLSGEPPALSTQDVLKYFVNNPLLDLLLDGGKIEYGKPSKVIDLTTSPYTILR